MTLCLEDPSNVRSLFSNIFLFKPSKTTTLFPHENSHRLVVPSPFRNNPCDTRRELHGHVVPGQQGPFCHSCLSQHGMGRMGLRDSKKTQKTAVSFAWNIYEVQPLQSTGKSSHSQPQNGFVLYVFLLDLKSLSEITSSGKPNENHPQLIPFFPLWGYCEPDPKHGVSSHHITGFLVALQRPRLQGWIIGRNVPRGINMINYINESLWRETPCNQRFPTSFDAEILSGAIKNQGLSVSFPPDSVALKRYEFLSTAVHAISTGPEVHRCGWSGLPGRVAGRSGGMETRHLRDAGILGIFFFACKKMYIFFFQNLITFIYR